MRSARITGGVLLVAAGMIAAAMPARAQFELPDSIAALQDSVYVPRYRFSPVYTNKINAGVSFVGMSNEFRTSLLTPWGSFFDFQVSGEEKNYRLSNQLDETKQLRLTDIHTFNVFWNGSLNFSDSRIYNRAASVGGGLTEFIINDQTLSLGTTYKRTLRDLVLGDMRTDFTGSGGAINSERTFKNDQGLQGGVNGGVAYNIGDRIVWQGRGAVRNTWDESTTIDSLYTGLGSNEDSVMTGFTVFAADSIRLDATHKRYDGDRDFTDQSRGSLGTQTGGAESVFQENETRSTRNTTLLLASRIARRFVLTLTASHDEQALDYRVQSTRDSKRIGDLVTGMIVYTMPWRSTASVQFENGETLNDFGPLSNASLTDKRKRVSVSYIQNFSKTFSATFNGSSQISQSFYVRYSENPRDRDQVDTNLSLRVTSAPFNSVSASISVGYTNSSFVNIDSTQSSNNRSRELWDLRPQFTWYVMPRFIITQAYGLSFDYTDYDFEASQNFLDRNITFTNTFACKPIDRVDLIFEYSLHLHDSGSYLPDEVTGAEVYNIASEDRRDRTRIRVDYRPIKEIGFFAENIYSRREEWTPGEFEDRDITTDGQIQVGSSANYDWGAGKILRFTVSKVKRFSPFGAEAEKDYWDARSEIVYPF